MDVKPTTAKLKKNSTMWTLIANNMDFLSLFPWLDTGILPLDGYHVKNKLSAY
jgi:hypothetical protein